MATQEELILAGLPDVRYIALKLKARLPWGLLSFDDLMQEGTLGLISAVNSFEEGHGATIKCYAQYRIRGAMLDAVRKLTGRGSYKPRPEMLPLAAEDEDGEVFEYSLRSREPDPQQSAESSEVSRLVRLALRRLKPRDVWVLWALYGLELTQKETGARLGICESRVCQLHKAALKRLSLSPVLATWRVAA